MDQGTRLALRAIVQGLHHSGQIGAHGLAVIVDELRYALREARDEHWDEDGAQIALLAEELHGIGEGAVTRHDPVVDQIARLKQASSIEGLPIGSRGFR